MYGISRFHGIFYKNNHVLNFMELSGIKIYGNKWKYYIPKQCCSE